MTPKQVTTQEFYICPYCSQQLSTQDENQCRKEARQLCLETIDWRHISCFNQIEKASIQEPTITIPRSVFDKLNIYRLLIEHDSDLNEVTNKYIVDVHTRRLFKNLSHDQQINFIARAQIVAATMRTVSGASRRDIEESQKAREKAHASKVQEIRNAPQTKVEQKHKDLAARNQQKEDNRLLREANSQLLKRAHDFGFQTIDDLAESLNTTPDAMVKLLTTKKSLSSLRKSANEQQVESQH